MYGGVDVFGGGIVCFVCFLFVIQIPLGRSLEYTTEGDSDSADGMTLDGLRK